MPPVLDAHDIDAAVAAVSQLNPAPGVLARASAMMSDDDSSLNEVSKLIEMDPSLTADVLRVSNSVAFGFATQATNLHSAIGRVGFDEVLHILAMCVSKNLGTRDLEHYQIDAYQHWARTVSVAILMEVFAERIGENAQDAYAIGILHSVGRVAIDHILSDLRSVNNLKSGEDVVAWELRVLGVDYAQVGASLLKHWNFSNLICQPVERQIVSTDGARSWPLLESLRFALDIVSIAGSGFEQKFLVDESLPYVQTYMLNQHELEKILDEAAETFRMHQEALGVYQ